MTMTDAERAAYQDAMDLSRQYDKMAKDYVCDECGKYMRSLWVVGIPVFACGNRSHAGYHKKDPVLERLYRMRDHWINTSNKKAVAEIDRFIREHLPKKSKEGKCQ